MFEFATANPGYTFLIVWVLAWAATRPFWYAWVAYNRTLRSRNIVAHGWPTAPVDADGDVVYPKNDD
jgi:hypothetical protein